MDIQKRSTRFGAALILFAVLLRLCSGVLGIGFHLPQLKVGQGQHWQRPGATLQLPAPGVPEGEPQWYRFTASDLQYTRVQYAWDCGYRPELEELLLQQLSWNLSGSAPKVLILHTHASESYTRQPGQNYTEAGDYRTLEEAYNMVAVGDYLAQLLTEAGIGVIHDRQIHDYPSYNDAYIHARESIRTYLAQYPSICLVLDLHRDAALNADGSQYAASVPANGERTAQIMLVMGTDASGNYHPNWRDNLALALKLQVLLEKQTPGITRQTVLRAQRFNQDLAKGMMLVEIGAAGNSLEEAMRAVPLLAQAVARLMHGANG